MNFTFFANYIISGIVTCSKKPQPCHDGTGLGLMLYELTYMAV